MKNLNDLKREAREELRKLSWTETSENGRSVLLADIDFDTLQDFLERFNGQFRGEYWADDMICEQHLDQCFPHGDCEGSGMPNHKNI